MDLTDSQSERRFRDELRAWLSANEPGPEPLDEAESFAWRLDWQRRLHEARWAAAHWPEEFGGRGASVTESAIFYEELASAGAPLPANSIGILLAGPTVMHWGTGAQKDRFLPSILSGDEIWCQGFSEPDAGSDLASLKTRAVAYGDEWVVTGQKVWTSYAHHAKWCMLVARTDPDAPKHKGLTYFLLDMEQDAVEIRPLRQITGETEFNEVFLDGARIPADHVLGGVNNGWAVTITTLMNERAGFAFFLQVRMRQLLDKLIRLADDQGLLDDPLIADRLGDLHVRAEFVRLIACRGLTSVAHDGQPGPEGSLTKWAWSETNQMLVQYAADLLGPEVLTAGTHWSYELLRARGHSIEGGTTEIQKNILAERVLGLPRMR